VPRVLLLLLLASSRCALLSLFLSVSPHVCPCRFAPRRAFSFCKGRVSVTVRPYRTVMDTPCKSVPAWSDRRLWACVALGERNGNRGAAT